MASRAGNRRTATLLLLLTGVLGSCAGGSARARGGLAGERTAALARVVVDNRTDLRLDVAFRYTVAPGGEVGIGSVAPGARTELAPIPAAEPIVLMARAAGFVRVLEPRSFTVDELWVWVITEEGDGGR